MKKIIFPVLSFFVLMAAMPSCKEGADIDMAQIHKVEDSLEKFIPLVRPCTVNVRTVEQEELVVTIGSPLLFQTSPQAKQEVAVRIAAMALQVFGTDNRLKSGKLVISNDSRNQEVSPKDGIITDMKIDSLKKSMAKK